VCCSFQVVFYAISAFAAVLRQTIDNAGVTEERKATLMMRAQASGEQANKDSWVFIWLDMIRPAKCTMKAA
jgi:hypothetical protein